MRSLSKHKTYGIYVLVFLLLLFLSLYLQTSGIFTSLLMQNGEKKVYGQYTVSWNAQTDDGSMEASDEFMLYIYPPVDQYDDLVKADAYWFEEDTSVSITGKYRNSYILFDPFDVSLTTEDNGVSNTEYLTIDLGKGKIDKKGELEGEIKVLINNIEVEGEYKIDDTHSLNGIYGINALFPEEQTQFVPMFFNLSQINNSVDGEVLSNTYESGSVSGTMIDEKNFEFTGLEVPIQFDGTTGSATIIGKIRSNKTISGTIELISGNSVYYGTFTGEKYSEKDDSDGDTISDAEEIVPGIDGFVTNPKSKDTDNDTYQDNAEIDNGFDPTFPDNDLSSLGIYDLKSTDPYYKSLILLVRNGILSPVGGNINPDKNATIAETAKIAVMAFLPHDEYETNIEYYLGIAEEYGLIDYSDDVWKVAQKDEIIYMLNAAIGITPNTSQSTPFIDTSSSVFEGDINAAYYAGLISGATTQQFQPTSNVTRGQLAYIVRNYIEYVDLIGNVSYDTSGDGTESWVDYESEDDGADNGGKEDEWTAEYL